MDREPLAPSPPPELKYDEAEEEQERGTIRLLMKEEDDEVEEYGVEGLRYENGELLLAREDEAIRVSESNHWVSDSDESTQSGSNLALVEEKKKKEEEEEEVEKKNRERKRMCQISHMVFESKAKNIVLLAISQWETLREERESFVFFKTKSCRERELVYELVVLIKFKLVI